MNKLFSAVTFGTCKLGHRVVMAPLTRMRSDPTEATPVSLKGYGYAGVSGVSSDTQIAGWRRITDAVHALGGKIVMQLWHVGRQSRRALSHRKNGSIVLKDLSRRRLLGMLQVKAIRHLR